MLNANLNLHFVVYCVLVLVFTLPAGLQASVQPPWASTSAKARPSLLITYVVSSVLTVSMKLKLDVASASLQAFAHEGGEVVMYMMVTVYTHHIERHSWIRIVQVSSLSLLANLLVGWEDQTRKRVYVGCCCLARMFERLWTGNSLLPDSKRTDAMRERWADMEVCSLSSLFQQCTSREVALARSTFNMYVAHGANAAVKAGRGEEGLPGFSCVDVCWPGLILNFVQGNEVIQLQKIEEGSSGIPNCPQRI